MSETQSVSWFCHRRYAVISNQRYSGLTRTIDDGDDDSNDIRTKPLWSYAYLFLNVFLSYLW